MTNQVIVHAVQGEGVLVLEMVMLLGYETARNNAEPFPACLRELTTEQLVIDCCSHSSEVAAMAYAQRTSQSP